LAFLGLGFGIQSVRYVHQNRPVAEGTTEGTGLDDAKRGQREFLRSCLVPLIIAVLSAVVCWAWGSRSVNPVRDPGWIALGFGLIGGGGHLAGWGPPPPH